MDHFIIIKRLIHQDVILNIRLCDNRVSKDMNQKLIELQEEIDKSTFINQRSE